MALPFVSSTNDYFFKPENKLILNWEVVETYLITQQYVYEEISIYRKAYYFFIKNPSLFDGATMTEDLHDVFNLDLDAMLHDFFYLHYNVSISYKLTQIADDNLYYETLRKGKSSWNAGVRKILLKLKSLLGFNLYAKYVAKRIMTQEDKYEFLSDIKTLKKGQ